MKIYQHSFGTCKAVQ